MVVCGIEIAAADPRSTPMATLTAMHHSHLALQTVVSTSVPEAQHTGLEQRLAQASLRRVEAKEFVFAEGDPTTHIFQVETGAVALYKVLGDGRRQVVGFAYPGDLIGLGAEGEHVMNAQAIKPTRLRCLPVASLNQIARSDPRLGFKLYEALARELAATRDLLLTTGQRSATERVVSFLLAFSRRNERNAQDPCMFDLPMTRADIADFLGLTIETVSRTFTKLKVQGLIELPQSSTVHIADLAGLRGLAGGEDVF
jgi:CRP/FNR family transcriptional regulator